MLVKYIEQFYYAYKSRGLGWTATFHYDVKSTDKTGLTLKSTYMTYCLLMQQDNVIDVSKQIYLVGERFILNSSKRNRYSYFVDISVSV